MITLTRLRELAQDAFPGLERHTLIHLLMVWGRYDDGELAGYLDGCGLAPDGLSVALESLLEQDDPLDTELFIAIISKVSGEALKGVHLLRGLVERPAHRISRELVAAGLDLMRFGVNLGKGSEKPSSLAAVGVDVGERFSSVNQFGRDLTKLAKEGAFDELCELPGELLRLTDVLLRKRKGNPVLTGPAGVGKTALVELLARDAANNPDSPFHGWKIYELSMGRLVAGTKYRGEFEARFEMIMQAVRDAEPAILFIDEIHLLLGSGRAEGAAMDGANLMKPHLSRDGFRVIGATTGIEYLRYIARDEALARRFQELKLKEPEPALLFAMIRRQANALASHHSIAVSDGMVQCAIEQTDRYLPNRRQPDKSIDLLDSSMVATRRAGRSELTEAELTATLARLTGLPIDTLTGADKGRLKEMSGRIKQRIIGQDQAVDKVSHCLIQRRFSLGNEERPLGVFLFAGDTGVGKTELARAVAAEFFGDPKRLIRIDLAEYSTPGSVQKLIGSPAGFVRSDEAGSLIAGLQAWPSAVLLFDELEKADQEVHKLLLGLLDTGRITSAQGDLFEVRQSVIIMTTNAITSKELEKRQMGFGAQAAPADPAELLGHTFPREFLGRLDEIIPFCSLGDADLRAILKLRLSEAEAKLSRKGVRLEYDEVKLLDILLSRLKSRQSGARGIARLLEREILQPMAMRLLERENDEELVVNLDEEL